MTQRFYTALPHRAVISVAGEDRVAFLQGLVSCDVTKASPDQALYGAMLTPQGKFLYDFFLIDTGDALLLETEAARRPDFAKRLGLYKLRSKVVISQPDDLAVYALWGAGAISSLFSDADAQPGRVNRTVAALTAFIDPRLDQAGLRALVTRQDEAEDSIFVGAGFAAAPFEQWDSQRIGLGLPDGSRDMTPDKAILLENGFDELAGVDFQKGCYMGQELTARTKYRGLIKKRLMPVEIDGPAPDAGTEITLNGEDAGEMRSRQGQTGLALIRLAQWRKSQESGTPLRAGDATLRPRQPAWAIFPQTED